MPLQASLSWASQEAIKAVINILSNHYTRDNTHSWARSLSTVASTLASRTGGSISFSSLAAAAYSGASCLQWPHLKQERTMLDQIQSCTAARNHQHHHTSSPCMEKKAQTNLLLASQFSASQLISFKVLPASSISSTVHFHEPTSLCHFLFSGGAHLSAMHGCLVSFICKTWPSHFHLFHLFHDVVHACECVSANSLQWEISWQNHCLRE